MQNTIKMRSKFTSDGIVILTVFSTYIYSIIKLKCQSEKDA